MRLRTVAAVTWLAVGLAVTTPAEAVTPLAVLAHSGGYVASEVVIVQGGSLTLVNGDATQQWHDIVSRNYRNGAPVFRSALIPAGGVSDVVGVAALEPSVYPFYCSVHDFMVGNLTVVAAPAR
jgi:hypothetical protein